MSWADVGTLLGMLAAVVVILLAAWLFTRYFAGRTGGITAFSRGREGNLRLLARLPLGREQSLAVVQAGELILLLGVANGQISLVRELNAQEAERWTKESTAPLSSGGPIPFQDALREVWNQRKKKN
jgi:flagellar protein FliO/FliZ